ncbi:MAG: DUF2087 domain-containing protein [Chloroflexi bacterium]|nr:DUF2087 domain-containing protein [Chloroflexota bacterium]
MDIPAELSTYIDDEGRLKEWPARKRQLQRAALEYLASKFETGRAYSEKEVNDLLKQWHTFADWALLRREMFEGGLLNRDKDGARYWRTPNTTLY